MVFRSPLQSMWDLTIHPFQGPAFSLTLVPFSNRCGTLTKSTPLGPSILNGTLPRVYPLREIASLLVHCPISTPGNTLLTHYPVSTPLRNSLLADTSLSVCPLSENRLLTNTSLSVCPFLGTTSSLAHRLLSGSDTICNDPSPLLVDIVLFGFSRSSFPSRFLKRVF